MPEQTGPMRWETYWMAFTRHAGGSRDTDATFGWEFMRVDATPTTPENVRIRVFQWWEGIGWRSSQHEDSNPQGYSLESARTFWKMIAIEAQGRAVTVLGTGVGRFPFGSPTHIQASKRRWQQECGAR